MVDDVLLVAVAHLVDKVHVDVGIIGIHFAPALVDGHEHGFNAAGGLRHERGGAGGCDGETSDVAPAILYHVGIELGVSVLDAQHEGVVLLALGIVDGEGSALVGHSHR